MDAFKSGFQSEERFNESGEDNDFVLVVGAFCLTPGTPPSVICPLIHACCRAIVWEMKKPFWSERRSEKSRLFCSMALVVKASWGSPEVKGIMITLQPCRSFSGLHIPPGDPAVKRALFGWWWNWIALQTNMNVLLRGEYRSCSGSSWQDGGQFFCLSFQRASLIPDRDSQTRHKCGLKHFFRPVIESHGRVGGCTARQHVTIRYMCTELQQVINKKCSDTSGAKRQHQIRKCWMDELNGWNNEPVTFRRWWMDNEQRFPQKFQH